MAEVKYLAFINALNSYEQSSSIFLDFITKDQNILQAFAEKDRDTLFSLTSPLYDNICKKYNIRQFHFHTTDGFSFLRLQKPGKFGDDLKSFRASVVQANKGNEIIKGLEVGVDDLGFRVVTPVFAEDGTRLGSVECGGAVNLAFIENLQKSSSQAVLEGMNEMAIGVSQINNAVQGVNELTHTNKQSIDSLTTELGKFKV